MRDAERVYCVGMSPYGSHKGSTTVTMRLLRGNTVLEVDDVLIVETDRESLEAAWEENAELAEQGEQGLRLLDVTDAEADTLYARRMCSDEDDTGSVEYDEEATATGWRYTAADGSWLEIVGDRTAGTWRSSLASGTYKLGEDWDGKAVVRFTKDGDADGYLDIVPAADEDCFVKGTIW